MQSTLWANELALTSTRGAVYGPLSFTIGDGITVLAGPAGSGRTSLLLTLAGRMKASSGIAETLGHPLPRHARRAQKLTAIAGFDGIDSLESSVSVGAAVRERRAWISPWWAIVARQSDSEVHAVCRTVFTAAGTEVPASDTLIWDLDETQSLLLRISLALMGEPRMLFVDRIEQLQSTGARHRLWKALASIAEEGTVIVASATAPDTEIWAELGLTPTVIDTDPEA